MTQPWYTDPRMLAAGNARRRPAGESDLAQPGSAKAMPDAPSGPLTTGAEVSRRSATDPQPAFTAAFLAEAERVGMTPAALAHLYAVAYTRPHGPVPAPHRRPSLLARIFSRKARS